MPKIIDIKIKPPSLIRKELEDLLRHIADNNNTSIFAIKGSRRDKHIVRLRVLFCKRAKRLYPKITLKQLGEIINKDHSSIKHYLDYYRL